MKKFTTSFVAVLMIVMFATIAFAGPVDWFAEKMGYTPTSQYELQKAETAKAIAAANAATATANTQSNIITYGMITLLVLGGLGYFRRKDIATRILTEKPAKQTVL